MDFTNRIQSLISSNAPGHRHLHMPTTEGSDNNGQFELKDPTKAEAGAYDMHTKIQPRDSRTEDLQKQTKSIKEQGKWEYKLHYLISLHYVDR